jgi:rhodanese-related sulfurtransferase
MTAGTRFIHFETETENAHFEDVYDIEPNELLEKLQASAEICLVDVREADEFTGELGHIEKAQLMSLGTVPEKLGTLPRDLTIVFICRSGGRSSQATAFAKSRGYESVYNMRGGMLLWNKLELPTA